MNICPDHWTRLRAKIDERGLGHLVAQGGEQAAAMLADQLRREEATPVNFDPLITAWSSIGTNVMTTIERAGGHPLYLLATGPESPIDFGTYPNGADVKARLEREGKPLTWPRCGLCYCGLAHELLCKGCSLPQVDGYAWMLDRAADDAIEQARAAGLEPRHD